MWHTLPKPILCLAPLDDVTDVVFRQIVCEAAKPDVFFTEFINVDALCSKGRASQERRLDFTKQQHPIIAQIWGSKPENFRTIAMEVRDMGFDGIDINMGCPDKRFVCAGLCAGLIENRSLASEIIKATQEGWGDRTPRGVSGAEEPCPPLPISVKTRIGIKKLVTEEWISFLLQFDLAAITVHGRTVKEMSKVPAHWDEIQKAVKIRDEIQGHPSLRAKNNQDTPSLREGIKGRGNKKNSSASNRTLILGNGDILSREQALEYSKKYGVDGVMIGRGIFKNLWIFDPDTSFESVSSTEKIHLFSRHIHLWRKTYGETRNFEILKKFAKVYISGFDGASEMRRIIMASKSFLELKNAIKTAI